MKIGILTYFGAHNYGAFLQAFAIREVIKNYTDNDVELINYRTLREVQVYSVKKIPTIHFRHYLKIMPELNYIKLQHKTFEKSIRRYQVLSKEELISDSIEEFRAFVDKRYDLIITGSDEVWKTDGFRPFPNAYWLPDVHCRKAAFAVSSRNTTDMLSDDKKSLIKEYIESFDYIGVRDKATFNMISDLSHDPEKCHMNCDPTFLYDFTTDTENGKRILREKFGVKSSKRVIGLILSDGQYGQRIAGQFSENFEVVSLSSFISNAKNYAGLTPFEWIDVISACDMIISSRFHGIVFSIKNSRPFLAIEMDGYSLETSKIFDLLERNGMTHCYVKNGENISGVLSHRIPEFIKFAEQNEYTIDYSEVIESEKRLGEDGKMFFSQI